MTPDEEKADRQEWDDLIMAAAVKNAKIHWHRVEDELPEIGVEVIVLRRLETPYSNNDVQIGKWTGEKWNPLMVSGVSNVVPVIAWIPMPTFAEVEPTT